MNLNAPLVVPGDARYAYATGIVRGKWVNRLGKAEFARLLDADPDEIGKLLSELGFAGADSDPEAAIAAEWERTIELAESLSQDRAITDLFRMSTDFTNAALAVKAAIFDFAPTYLPNGSVSAEEMAAFASGEGRDESIPQDLRDAMREAKGLFEKTQTPLAIDIALDGHFGKIFVARMSASRREFLVRYARMWADIQNLTSCLRIRAAGLDIAPFEGYFIDGGYIEKAELSSFQEIELDAISARLVFSPYGKPLADAVAESIREENFEPLATFLETQIEDFLRTNVYVSFGLEVLVAYALLKRREIRAVGAILRMKRAKIDKKRIEERVRYGDV